jgi:aminoglycoside phosphotransferase family enzyme
VEFDAALRYGDIASEIAFLAMDLDFFGRADLSRQFETAYAAAARDSEMATLLPFYKCYRACVRGKVESLKARSTKFPPPIDNARLCRRCATSVWRPDMPKPGASRFC